MTDFIFEEFNQGILLQIYEAERNIRIWQNIADQIEFLKTQTNDIQQLYSFLQLASQTNFILSVGKIFDTPRNYPTQSIIYFLEKVEQRAYENVAIIEDKSTISLLRQFQAPDVLIASVNSDDKSEFPKQFVKYYREKYQSEEVQADIEKVKFIRDKSVAHNEALKEIRLEFESVYRLLEFATEIVAVFGMAYHSTIWKQENVSLIRQNAERSAFFIMSTIKKLKSQ